MPVSKITKNTTVKKSATKKTPAKAPKTSVKKTNSAATTPIYKPGGLFSKKTKEIVLRRQNCMCPLCGAHLDYTNDGVPILEINGMLTIYYLVNKTEIMIRKIVLCYVKFVMIGYIKYKKRFQMRI